jgi:hypothetical protein
MKLSSLLVFWILTVLPSGITAGALSGPGTVTCSDGTCFLPANCLIGYITSEETLLKPDENGYEYIGINGRFVISDCVAECTNCSLEGSSLAGIEGDPDSGVPVARPGRSALQAALVAAILTDLF